MNTWLNPVVDTYIKNFGLAHAPIVWEVGSRDGHDCYELMQRIAAGWRAEQQSTLVCVEPNPEQAKVIHRTYPQAIVHELAAGEKHRKAKFKVYHGNKGDIGSSSLYMNWKKGSGLKSHVITVSVVRLEHLVGNKTIDIIKFDCEGYGYQALKGLGDKLEQVKVIHIETEHDSRSDVRVKKYLEKRGWIITDETEQWGGMPDITAVNTNLVSLN